MAVEQGGQVIAIGVGATGNGRIPAINGRRQPSRGGTSRMMREYHVRICERLGVNSPGLVGNYGHVRFCASATSSRLSMAAQGLRPYLSAIGQE